MKHLLSLAVIFSSILAFSQTDIIEMRSRNALVKKYERTSTSANHDHIATNFGMLPPSEHAPHLEVLEMSKAVLDSVKYVSADVAVMYTSRSCPNTNPPTATTSLFWMPGADTVYAHPLFRNKHALDSVKAVLDRDYIFTFSSDSTKFIGFDNGQGIPNEDAVEPVKLKRQKKKSVHGWEIFFYLITPIACVIGVLKLTIPRASVSN